MSKIGQQAISLNRLEARSSETEQIASNRNGMKLSLWVEDDIEVLPKDFTGLVVLVRGKAA